MGSPQAGKATTVTVRFLDDEIMEGRVGGIDLDQPNIELEMPDTRMMVALGLSAPGRQVGVDVGGKSPPRRLFLGSD